MSQFADVLLRGKIVAVAQNDGCDDSQEKNVNIEGMWGCAQDVAAQEPYEAGPDEQSYSDVCYAVKAKQCAAGSDGAYHDTCDDERQCLPFAANALADDERQRAKYGRGDRGMAAW